MPDERDTLAALREKVIHDMTVAPGGTLDESTALADALIDAARAGVRVAPSPDAPGLREALERIAKGHDWQPGQPTQGWASCQRIADAALAASGDAPREGLVNIRLLHDLFAGHDWGTIDSRCPFRPACEWESDEAIVNQMEATEYASESHPTKEQTE